MTNLSIALNCICLVICRANMQFSILLFIPAERALDTIVYTLVVA